MNKRGIEIVNGNHHELILTLVKLKQKWKSSQITRMGIVKYVERKSTWGMKNSKIKVIKTKIVYSIWKMCFIVNGIGSVGI